jgi:hypothetical protein
MSRSSIIYTIHKTLLGWQIWNSGIKGIYEARSWDRWKMYKIRWLKSWINEPCGTVPGINRCVCGRNVMLSVFIWLWSLLMCWRIVCDDMMKYGALVMRRNNGINRRRHCIVSSTYRTLTVLGSNSYNLQWISSGLSPPPWHDWKKHVVTHFLLLFIYLRLT